MKAIVLRGYWDPADRERNEFPLLPFQVPGGVGRLLISYDVDNAVTADRAGWDEGNIVDIGLFDPRGAAFPGGHGFRGWSGSSVNTFTVGVTEATPGYIPGPIQPGTWHILLGLYQLAPEGCNVRVTIRMEPAAGELTSVGIPCAFSREPLAPGPRWFRGDLHSHSHHSDGQAPLADLAAAARAQGLDFVAVTEHNTASHLPRLDKVGAGQLPLLIPGIEVSTYRGHANIWPVTDWWDFRCQTDAQMRQLRELARGQGALFSVNHPKDEGPDWAFGEFFEPDCVEVWGAPWFISNYQALAAWDDLLRNGQRVTAVGGSDKHQGPFAGELGWYELGTPTTWVWAEELSIPAIIDGLRAGRVVVSEGPGGPCLSLTAENGERRAEMGEALPVAAETPIFLTCHVVGAAGSLLRLVSAKRVLEAAIDADDFVHQWRVVVDGDRYFRPEVIALPEVPLEEDPAALMARVLGNPIYLPD